MSTIQLENMEGLQYLSTIDKNSVDLVFTDPPYITSRVTGMNKWVEHVAHHKNIAGNLKTEEDWRALKTASEWKEWTQNERPGQQRLTALRNAKKNYLKYGSIYGEKYAVRTDYGKWDSDFTMDRMEDFVKEFYRTLRPGGTCIIFFDIWKLSYLKEMLEKHKFKQIRLVEWIKTNPQPLNSSRNYLTNCREIALLAVKKGSPTFNSKYDNAVYLYDDPETYLYPIQGGKYRLMPTQKNTKLCEALIKKHSNEGDLVLDPFLGSGTTAVAAANTGRRFTGCELRVDMFNQMKERIEGELNGKE
jgi:DNA modification methylase